MLARQFNRILLCLQEAKTGLRTGGLASKTRQKIAKTGLRNRISHESEAVENPFLRPAFAEKNKGLTTNKIANQA